jgi:hypothetical protein
MVPAENQRRCPAAAADRMKVVLPRRRHAAHAGVPGAGPMSEIINWPRAAVP